MQIQLRACQRLRHAGISSKFNTEWPKAGHDRVPACAPELVVQYLKKVEAPKKEIIWFEGSAHHPNIDEPGKFQKMLVERVLTENYKEQ